MTGRTQVNPVEPDNTEGGGDLWKLRRGSRIWKRVIWPKMLDSECFYSARHTIEKSWRLKLGLARMKLSG